MERAGIKNLMLPSIGDVLFVSLFLRLLGTGTELLNDGDTGWHLVAGESILKSLSIPHSETFSHSVYGIEWISHEWLSEAVFALLHRLGGLNAVVVLSAATIAFTFWLMYRTMLKRGVNPLSAAAITVLAASVSAGSMLARPHIFSYALMLIFFLVLDGYQRGEKNRLLYLPLLMVLWVNLHAAFFLGLVFVFIYAAGNIVLYYVGDAEASGALKKSGRLFIILAACILASLINPHGAEILAFPFKLIGQENIIGNIQEWASPNFHKDRGYEVMLWSVLALMALSKKRPDIFEWATLIVVTHLSLSSMRFIPLFALVAGCIASTRLGDASGSLNKLLHEGAAANVQNWVKRFSGRIAAMEAGLVGHLSIIAVVGASVLVAFNGGRVGNTRVMDYTFSGDKFPVKAFEYVVRSGINGRVFNKDGWGGYILYKGYPSYRVFIDGRFETYGAPFMKEYLTVSGARYGCMDVLDKYKVDWVIFDSGKPLCQLLEAKGWRKVYTDTTADVLLRSRGR